MKTVGVVACSNPQELDWKFQNDDLVKFLESNNINVVMSKYIYKDGAMLTLNGVQRAEELMSMYLNPDIEYIFDISGGDMANEILDKLDFELIKNSKAIFWGYSDLTTVINAIYTLTGKSSILWQVKNTVVGNHQEIQRTRFIIFDELFNPSFVLVQGNHLNGVVIGGNIRCFLKLAGTRYFPDLTNKILFLESLGGEVPQMITYLSQLKSLGVFEKIKGILLGTFIAMEEKECKPDIIELVQEFVGSDMPIATTKEIGHRSNSKAIWIGKEISVSRHDIV